ncbi:hypothetical protein NUW54_g7409 [Trametes sanguinea]|uniref:Uncharacterized protein n=1 Tax=Trametes sanguinea TaxID=158606 RepID=A0ACC1PP48_9APHY|nr:hypothetical protein NUW54_g7409 [Trametes sanguinea]
MAERGRSGFQRGGGDAPHKSPPAVFAFCAQDSATSATLPGSREDTGRHPHDLKQLFPAVRERGEPCQALAALAERGTDLRSLERRARKRSRALRAVAAWFRIVSVTIQIPAPPRSASQSASASASALRPAFLSALRIAFHCVCDYCEVPANSVANPANSANQVCASIASCEAREDREAP